MAGPLGADAYRQAALCHLPPVFTPMLIMLLAECAGNNNKKNKVGIRLTTFSIPYQTAPERPVTGKCRSTAFGVVLPHLREM